jgi:hypothetical protein
MSTCMYVIETLGSCTLICTGTSIVRCMCVYVVIDTCIGLYKYLYICNRDAGQLHAYLHGYAYS